MIRGKMLAGIKHTISNIFLGDPVAETEEIYRTADGKFRIHLGLFRKRSDEIVWLKFVRKSFMTHSSSGTGIAVDTFQSFADFLGAARHKEKLDEGILHKVPLFARTVLAINEGVSQSKLLGEYRSKGDPKAATRFYSFTNRRFQHRVVFENKSSGQDTYEVFDFNVLTLLESEIANRAIRRRADADTCIPPVPDP